MKNRTISLMILLKYCICLPIAIGIPSSIQVFGQASPPMTSDVLEEKLENLPLLFRQNMGQWDEKILFSGSSGSANVYFMQNELSFGFRRAVNVEKEDTGPIMAAGKTQAELKAFAERKFNNKPRTTEYEYLVWNVRFEGANPNSTVAARGQAGSRTNYFIGNDPKKHCANVPDHRIITYQNIYENIDLKYYGNNDRLKYDFVLKPGAKTEDIRMTYAGVEKMRISKEGDLILSTAWGEMKEDKPFTYQMVNGRRTEIKSTYVLLNDSTVGFKMLEDYAIEKELIIDPIVLDWATFTGGTFSVKYGLTGLISKIAVDTAGNVFAVGSYATTFPTTPGSYDPTFGGGTGYDVIVFKMNPTGTALIYSTYMGGNQWDSGNNIYLDASGDVIITGQTSSSNWPVLNAYDPTYNGNGDIFVTRLNAAGTALVFSTFIGGSSADNGADVTLDAASNVYVAGNTTSANFPTTAGVYATALKGGADFSVSKLNPAGNTMIYSTLIGSSKNETAVGIGVNAAGEVTVGGNCDSTDFPTTAGAFDQTMNDGPNIYNIKGDMVVFKLNAGATGLIYGTYLGGNIGDVMQGFYLSTNDEAFVCGVILFSNNYPITPGVLGPTTANGTFDSFVTRFNSTGTALVYSTYLGNADQSSDEARDIWVNACDEAYVTGDGGSFATFPVTTGPCATCTGGEDVYLCKLAPTAANFVWSTFIGSKDWDVCQAIGVYVGSTVEEVAIGFGSNSFAFPTTAGVFQQNKPTTDSTNTIPGVAKYSNAISTGTANAGPDLTICPGAMVTLTGNAGATSYSWNPGGQTTSSISVSPSTTTSYTLTVTNSCGLLQDSVKVFVNSSITAAIAGNISICSGQSTTLTASGGSSYTWSTGASTAVISITPTASGTYSVVVSSGSCPPDTATVSLTVSNTPSASITGNSVVCTGQSITLVASGGGNYLWSNGSSASSIIISPSSATNYSVTVTAGSCSATATQSVAVMPGITLALTATQTGCTVNNGTATANSSAGTPPFTYSWSNGASTSSASGLGVGSYTVVVTDAGGCSKTQTVSVSSTSNLNGSASSTPTGCLAANGMALANGVAGTAPYTYVWSDGQSSQTASGLAAGNYTVTIIDANGCTKTATTTVTLATGPVATASASTVMVTLGGNTTLIASGGGTYQWSPASGLSCTTCANPTASPTETTEYCVIVTDANGCSDTACITIVVDVPCGNIYLPNAFSPNGDLENDLECVMGNCIADMHLIIYNRWGVAVFESNDQAKCWDGTHIVRPWYTDNPHNTAVFTYYLEATLTNGTKVNKKGNISLVR